jgi:hypothetical protein
MSSLSFEKKSFIERAFADKSTPAEITKALENNGLVDVVVEDNEGKLHLYTGEKINLEELGKAQPNIMIHDMEDLKSFDENNDGFLVESELKQSTKETFNDDVINGAVAFGVAGTIWKPIFGTALGAVAGMAVGACVGVFHAAITEPKYQDGFPWHEGWTHMRVVR